MGIQMTWHNYEDSEWYKALQDPAALDVFKRIAGGKRMRASDFHPEHQQALDALQKAGLIARQGASYHMTGLGIDVAEYWPQVIKERK